MDALRQKLENLRAYFKKLGSVAIAFSSGVDSTFMLKVASDVLPKDKILAITAVSVFLPQREKSEAEEFCLKHNIKHIFLPIDVLKIEDVAQNPQNRCYLCKYALFSRIKDVAAEKGIAFVCEGSNLDDLSDYRPGMIAIQELDIKSPLKTIGFTKQEIRNLSKEMKLPTWNKPSFACLASRFVYGEEITTDKLIMVERAEQILLDFGFKQVRVRIHGTMARIEVLPQDFAEIVSISEKIHSELHNLGFSYITLDLKGFRSGSMNENILKFR